jgi:hypothetical protein
LVAIADQSKCCRLRTFKTSQGRLTCYAKGKTVARKHDWSRALPQALDFASVVTVTTLGDVRLLVERHLPASRRDRPHWRSVARALTNAATGGGDAVEVEAALMLAGAIEGLSCRPTSRPSLRKSIPRRRTVRPNGE